MRTLLPLPYRVFADAAFTRRCGTFVVATQLASPIRSFAGIVLAATETVRSLPPDQTIETRTNRTCGVAASAAAECLHMRREDIWRRGEFHQTGHLSHANVRISFSSLATFILYGINARKS
ncbi:hypothetical protein B9057_14640 (plasmid) [Aestuarium zhoushanense]|nr:hypothetical protein B9057_06145 [Aestuarium zhoushanense]AUJ65637.1 hypothetical protein B9057_14640 [Aestuarium zhoushanense]